MSFKEITSLRKSGHLEEALQQVQKELETEPDDEWLQMAMFWVQRDLCQNKYLPNHKKKELEHALETMHKLLSTMIDNEGIGQKVYDALLKKSQPEYNVISQAIALSKVSPIESYTQVKDYIASPQNVNISFHEDLGWIIYRYIKAEVDVLPSVEVRTLLKQYMDLKNERPSLLHSSILLSALNFSKSHHDFNFYNFLILWDPHHLRPADFEDSFYNNHTIPSLISRIFRALIDNGHDFDFGTLCEKINHKPSEVIEWVREPFYWCIKQFYKEGKMNEHYDALAAYCNRFAPYGPSLWHSKILRMAAYTMKEQEEWRFIYFFKSWDYTNLREEDWQEQTDEKGNTYPSTAVKSAKKCFDCIKAMSNRSEDILNWISNLFDTVTSHVPDDEWVERERATIYIWQNKYDEAIRYYKELLLNMSEKYYIWGELASCIHDNIPLKIGLLSKALLCERNESFLGNIHLDLAENLLHLNRPSETLFELNTYKEKREKENWAIKPTYNQLLQSIPTGTKPPASNKPLYQEYAPLAEDFVFSEIETKEVLLLDRWEIDGKIRCTLGNGKDIYFQVNAKRFPILLKAKPGTQFLVKCNEEKTEKTIIDKKYNWKKTTVQETRYIPLCLHKTNKALWSSLPVQYGWAEYINKEKQVVHIVTQDNEYVFYHMKSENTIERGDFISFKKYTIQQYGETHVQIAQVDKCDRTDALPAFKSLTVVVDNVNTTKQLIHYEAGPGIEGGIIFFREIPLRPSSGDFLKIVYALKKDKEGKLKRVILSVEKTEEGNDNIRKTIEGNLTLKYKSYGTETEADFAFIDNCYVHKSILQKYHVDSDRKVKAEAVYAGNNKWKVIKIY